MVLDSHIYKFLAFSGRLMIDAALECDSGILI